MRFPHLLTAAAIFGLLAPLPLALPGASLERGSLVRSAHGAGQRADILPLSQVKKGMKGYGLTVFEGTKPDKFDVEVIDVIDNFLPRQQLILVKTKHPRIEAAKVVAGMSGSPIYLQGKMVGAYAYGWGFPVEPVAGVTPIENMLEDLDRPLPTSVNGWPIKLLPKGAKVARNNEASANRFSGKLAEYDLKTHAAQLASHRATTAPGQTSPVQQVATPVLVGGLTASAVEETRELLAPLGLEPIQAGGGGSAVDPNAPTRFEDGGAIAVAFSRGDISLQGLGTVTRVEGDKLVAFGHPMMSSGVTAMPTAIGKVHWFLASQQRSFKLGVPVRPMGALVNDRQASIVVSHSAVAPTVPITLTIKGLPETKNKKWSFEIAHERFITPTLFAVTLGNAVQTEAADRRDVTWSVKSKVTFDGFAPVEIEDFGVSLGGSPSPMHFIRTNLARAVGMTLNNPWSSSFVKRAEVEVELRFARDIFMLKGVDVLDAEVEPGSDARLRLELQSFDGQPFYKVIRVAVPKRFAGQSLSVSIQPGYMHAKEKVEPENLAELVSSFEDLLYPPRSVIVSYAAASSGLGYKGRVLKSLPPGAIDSVRSTSTAAGPSGIGTLDRQIFPLDQYMVGSDSVTINVRPALR